MFCLLQEVFLLFLFSFFFNFLSTSVPPPCSQISLYFLFLCLRVNDIHDHRCSVFWLFTHQFYSTSVSVMSHKQLEGFSSDLVKTFTWTWEWIEYVLVVQGQGHCDLTMTKIVLLSFMITSVFVDLNCSLPGIQPGVIVVYIKRCRNSAPQSLFDCCLILYNVDMCR